MLPGRVYRGLSVAGGGGALGIVACDTAEVYGLEVPLLQGSVRDQVASYLPKSGASAVNPIDVANPYTPPEILEKIFRVAAQDNRIDLQVLMLLPHHYKTFAGTRRGWRTFPHEELADRLKSVIRETRKPVVLVMTNTKRGLPDLDVVEVHAKARQTFLAKGIPVFDEIGDALRAIANVNRYYGKGETA
ncbi:MAG: hypothetical protein H6Q50_51 [Deltaproteobacteria bacterium]|nr:hypothetical protein [Deltaproteobacteria bacterium]